MCFWPIGLVFTYRMQACGAQAVAPSSPSSTAVQEYQPLTQQAEHQMSLEEEIQHLRANLLPDVKIESVGGNLYSDSANCCGCAAVSNDVPRQILLCGRSISTLSHTWPTATRNEYECACRFPALIPSKGQALNYTAIRVRAPFHIR